jgi:hypothetical protein
MKKSQELRRLFLLATVRIILSSELLGFDSVNYFTIVKNCVYYRQWCYGQDSNLPYGLLISEVLLSLGS